MFLEFQKRFPPPRVQLYHMGLKQPGNSPLELLVLKAECVMEQREWMLCSGSCEHARTQTAQCLMGHVTVTMDYRALSSTAVKWRQKWRTGFLGPADIPTQMHSSKALHDLYRNVSYTEISHKEVKCLQLLDKAFRDVYAPIRSIVTCSSTTVDMIQRWQVAERVGHLSHRHYELLVGVSFSLASTQGIKCAGRLQGISRCPP